MKIKILVAAHKEFPMPADTEIYMPILVGATKNYHPGINYQRDDDGENISKKNPNYNELTAIYWAWKNLSADVVGLTHYRRMFSLKRSGSLIDVLRYDDITHLLMRAPIVLPKKRNYYIETNYSHYIHAHQMAPLLKLREVLVSKGDIRYVKAYDSIMKKKSAHMFNMFIMKKKYFDNYSKWLFNTLLEVESEVDITEYNTQEKRAFGYLSELMMDIWIQANNYRYVECNWIFLGNQKILKKAFYFLMRKFGILKKTHF